MNMNTQWVKVMLFTSFLFRERVSVLVFCLIPIMLTFNTQKYTPNIFDFKLDGMCSAPSGGGGKGEDPPRSSNIQI